MPSAETTRGTSVARLPVLNVFLTGLRIFVGWHFLYEGLAKQFDKTWTSAGYLLESHWIFSGFFHWIANHPAALKAVDWLNIGGLSAIGLGLMLGCLTRAASVSGAVLILLYYVANPPFVGFVGESTGEGHYLVVNKNLIEMALLVLFVFLPVGWSYGFDRWFYRNRQKSAEPDTGHPSREEGSEARPDRGRRELLKDLVGLPFLGGLTAAALEKWRWESFEERHLVSQPSRTEAQTGASPHGLAFASLQELKGPVPRGKIKHLEVSRLICGGNLIAGYAHSRDLIYVSSLVQGYFTDEKVLDTFRLCEACGINTMVVRVDKNTLRLLEKYRRRGGAMHWFAQAKISKDDMKSDIDAAVDGGAAAVYIHGGICDDYVAKENLDALGEALVHIRGRGVLGGLGAHDLRVPIACEKAGLYPDFYLKTLNSANYWTAGPRIPKAQSWKPDPKRVVEPEFQKDTHDNIWETTPLQTIEYMKEVVRPWIAYKVLGAGAIHPKEGFAYAFENGADFLCVGMFDFQVVEDANLVTGILAKGVRRTRPWQG